MNHSLFDFKRKTLWESIEGHISGKNNQEQIKLLELVLNQNNSIFEDFIIRTLLMSNWAALNNLESANMEAKKARDVFEKNSEFWNSTIDFIEFPAESLFITCLHWVPIYPDSIRPDLDEESRKRAALDMMVGYYEVFVTFRVIRILLFSFYSNSNDQDKACLELKAGVTDFNADSHLCSPIFHAMLGFLYKEKGELVLSYDQFKTSLTDTTRAQELFSLFEDDAHEVFMEKVKAALEYWKAKVMTASSELEDRIPKNKCFIATAVYGNTFNPNVIYLKQFRDQRLCRTRTGRRLIDFYYFLSPPIAMMIEKSAILKVVVERVFLCPIIRLFRTLIK